MKQPRPHQIAAIEAAKSHYSQHDRGLLAMACGTGKSLTALLIAKILDADKIVITLPKLNLQSQTAKTWVEEIAATEGVPILCVGSDKNVADVSWDNVIVTTKYEIIKDFLLNEGKKIIITTYQSTPVLQKAIADTDTIFDFGIIDEAHRTAGKPTKKFASVVFDENIIIKKRLFMTATPINFSDDKALSMDNPVLYGNCFYSLSLNDAIEQNILCDYKVIVSFVDTSQVRVVKNAKNRLAALAVSIQKSISQYGLKRILTFHKDLNRAASFQNALLPKYEYVGHINHKSNMSQRKQAIADFKENDGVSIITNVRIMSEGVDIPEVDAIVLSDVLRSHADIIQVFGRALRKSENKEMSYIILPIFVYQSPEGTVNIINDAELESVRNALYNLSITDNRIFKELQDMAQGKPIANNENAIINFKSIKGINPFALNMTEFEKTTQSLATSLMLRTWNITKRTNWLSFDEAKAYATSIAQEYGIDSQKKWQNYIKGQNPHLPIPSKRVPTNPNDYYMGKGWNGWEDFFGKEIDVRKEQLQKMSMLHRQETQIDVKGLTATEIQEKYKVSKPTAWRASKRGFLYLNYHKNETNINKIQ